MMNHLVTISMSWRIVINGKTLLCYSISTLSRQFYSSIETQDTKLVKCNIRTSGYLVSRMRTIKYNKILMLHLHL
uniref:Uncharacterized protein n=1 Tax=Pararge aegeria TaxID=116150 RepID=S4PF05_9NEOP